MPYICNKNKGAICFHMMGCMGDVYRLCNGPESGCEYAEELFKNGFLTAICEKCDMRFRCWTSR